MANLEHTFTVGQTVSFTRNSLVKSEGTVIVSKVINENENTQIQEDLFYVIEHETGWLPNSIRKTKFGLDETKKYLFVQEKELTLVETN